MEFTLIRAGWEDWKMEHAEHECVELAAMGWPEADQLGIPQTAKKGQVDCTVHFSAVPLVEAPFGCRWWTNLAPWALRAIHPILPARGWTHVGRAHGQVVGMGP